MTNVDVLRVRVGDRVNRQLDRTVLVLKNLDARITIIRQEETPHGPQENCILRAFLHCNVLGLTRGEYGAILRPRNSLDGRPPPHHGSTRYIFPLSHFRGTGFARINHQLQATTHLERHTVAARHRQVLQNASRGLPVLALGFAQISVPPSQHLGCRVWSG